LLDVGLLQTCFVGGELTICPRHHAERLTGKPLILFFGSLTSFVSQFNPLVLEQDMGAVLQEFVRSSLDQRMAALFLLAGEVPPTCYRSSNLV
jgi:hypothetical protein